jgi:leader peptidase (prepilin peptidase)/N-methyltransferase
MTFLPLALLALIGLMVGSFLNVCISRLPAGESVVSPRSRCRSCRAPVAWHDNLPLVSYLVLGGRCRQCRSPIGFRYPVVEAVTAGTFVLQGLVYWPDTAWLAARLVFTALLVALFFTDLETERLPNGLTFSGGVAGAVFSLMAPPGLRESLLGVLCGGGLLLAVRWGWKAATGVEGMGLGDVKMLAMIGAFLGWRLVIPVLFLASIGGAVVGIALATARGWSMQQRLPFGTFLAVAAYAASLIGDSLLSWYLASF